MQNKERKWIEVEKILEEYVEDDDELREKLYELRINVESNKKISNVVEENERLKQEMDQLMGEVKRLRKQLIKIGMAQNDETINQEEEEGEEQIIDEEIQYTKDIQPLYTEINEVRRNNSQRNNKTEEDKNNYEENDEQGNDD